MSSKQPSTKALLLALMISSASAFSSSGMENLSVRSVGVRIRSGEKQNGFSSETKPVGWLQYRNGDEGISQLSLPSVHRTRTEEDDTNTVWWKSLFPAVAVAEFSSSSSSAQDESSLMAEEYMKFLDKRYNQIRESDPALKTKQQKQQAPPILGWLNKEGTQTVAAIAEVPKDAVASMDASISNLFMVNLKQSALYARVVKSRSALLKYQAMKFQQFMTALVNVLKRVPQVPSFLMKAGGGKQPTKVALSLLVVVVFQLVLPAVSNIIRETYQA